MSELPPRPESVQVSVGTVFRVSPSSSRRETTHLIVDIGSGTNFEVVPLYYDEDGRPYWRMVNIGTAGPKDIGQITDQLSLDEVIVALRRGTEPEGYSVHDSFLATLHQNAARGQRTLVLKHEGLDLTSQNPTRRTEIVIDKSHIDHYGHVNYQQYLKLFEIGQDDYMKCRGIGFDTLDSETGLRSVVRAVSIVYSGQLRAGDKPVIVTAIKQLGNSSFTFIQHIELDGVTTTVLEMVVVLANDSGKVAIPNFIREKLLLPEDN